jgi:hypothetical protein
LHKNNNVYQTKLTTLFSHKKMINLSGKTWQLKIHKDK